MTAAELSQLRGVLERSQADLERMLRNRDGLAVESNADVIDQIQHATEREMAIGNLERDSARLGEVRAALGRMDEGTYGVCVECEEEITPKRLRAVPWTASCLVCREAADRQQASPDNSFDATLFD